jgi:hypothetical protein
VPVAEIVPTASVVPVAALAPDTRGRAIPPRRDLYGPRDRYAERPPPVRRGSGGGSTVLALVLVGVVLSLFVGCGSLGVLVALAQMSQAQAPSAPSLAGTWTCNVNDPIQGQSTLVLRLSPDGTYTAAQRLPGGEVARGAGRYSYADGVLSTTQPNGVPLDASRIEWLNRNQIRATYLRGPGPVGAQSVWSREG